MSALFGTDGIRAPFGTAPLDRPTVTALGGVLAEILAIVQPAPVVVVGGDTRDSTATIAAWLAAGLAAGGARPRWLGVVPTPGVAWLTARSGAAAGVSVSASHNPHPDNGIKLIDARGGKWTTAGEALVRKGGAVVTFQSPSEPSPLMFAKSELSCAGLLPSKPPST